MTKKEQFLKGFDGDAKMVLVGIQMPDCPDLEVISNSSVNFEAKKKYYDTAYDDDLVLKSFNKIKIVEYSFN